MFFCFLPVYVTIFVAFYERKHKKIVISTVVEVSGYVEDPVVWVGHLTSV